MSRPDPDLITLVDDDVVVTVHPRAGGRIGSLLVAGTEILVTGDIGEPPMLWGSFPMAPWAGRVRNGRVQHDGVEYALPLGLPPHAIHGTTYVRPWTVTSSSTTTVSLHIDLGDDWPFGGWAEQRISVQDHVVRCELSVTASDRSMPAQVGWHPWFRKPIETRVRFAGMYLRDGAGIPTGEVVSMPPGPWDDCFVDALSDPTVVVPGHRGSPDVEVRLASNCDHWVVYDQPDHATCIEPQSGPPDGFTLSPHVVASGATLHRWMTFTVSTRAT